MALLVPALLLGGAIGSQIFGGLTPCEMCIWQRWPHGAAILLALGGYLLKGQRRLMVMLAALAIAVSGGIGVYHAGVELDIFEGLTSCASTTAGGLDTIMGAPIVRCDAVQWEFLGISMAGWNAIISLGAAALIAIGISKKGRA
ncbi:disulfide bond formation protein B [Sphingomicrobium sediminis]|uniref:Disulfide bond formation protein B n=1 Tax=Sphingomicrobium sediminis TaxID=2950949 RepID=A0A9X2EGP4_9SPHN|nr:disulfide bond formation protein B [Sphingomicrobium sediminis]MCM8557698.1 disulfide bond formation protein B [Sphingomicrobium sediminis]